MVIRGYLVGHLWREYKSGKRVVCGVNLPDGLLENQQLPTPIITPTTKASEGHDEDISVEAIIEQAIVSKEHMDQLCAITHKLFQRGQEMASDKHLILVDTKYEFVHNVGSLDFNNENSSRSILEDIPFIRLTTLCIPNCGSTSKSK